MKKQRWIIAFGLLALIGTGFVTVNLLPREPLFEGKPEGFWVDQLPASFFSSTWTGGRRLQKHYCNTSEAEREARGILQRAGTTALPYLTKRLRSRDSAIERLLLKPSHRSYRYDLYRRIWKPPLPGLTWADFRRGQALTAILDCHFDKNEVVLALLEILKSDAPEAVECAKYALTKIDPEAIATRHRAEPSRH